MEYILAIRESGIYRMPMAKSDPCPKCGVNMNMVGKAHRCVPSSPVPVGAVLSRPAGRPKMADAVTRAVVRRTIKAGEQAAVKSSESATPMVGDDPLVPVVLKLPRSFWSRIENYWHQEKLPSRTAGVRALLERGLIK